MFNIIFRRKWFYILLFLVLFFSCSNNNIKVTSIINNQEIEKLIASDTLYKIIIPEVQKKLSKIKIDKLLQLKFKNYTYNRYYHYKKTCQSKAFKKTINIKIDSIYYTNFLKYKKRFKPRIDSIFKSYKQLYNKEPKRFFRAELSKVRKNLDADKDLISIDLFFKIKVLKQPIKDGVFTYSITPIGEKEAVAVGGCSFEDRIKNYKVIAWQAPIFVESLFANKSINYIKNSYKFEYSYLSVKTDKASYFANDMESIPKIIRKKLHKTSLSELDYKQIMKDRFLVKLESKQSIKKRVVLSYKQEIDKLSFDYEMIK